MMQTEKLTFEGHGGDMLAARLEMPAGRHLATAVFAHCFTCSKDIPAARRIAQRLSAMGIAVLRFDFTGLGHSDGEFANTGFSSNVDDLKLAARHLASIGKPVDILIGHSLGGAAVLKAAGDLDHVKAVVTIGAPSDPSHVAHNFSGAIPKIEAKGSAKVSLAGRDFTIRKSFLDDIRAAELKPAIADMKSALLVLHSPIDDTVGIENASEIFLAAKHPKSFVTLDRADHLVTRAEDAEYVADVIAAWVQNYLPMQKAAAPIGAPEGIVRVTESDPGGFLQDVSSGPRHHALADEPLAYGGTDQGMSPYQFLSAGLGACTSMTIRMYARRKKWPLSGVSVDITHDKLHATDCEHCDQPASKIDQFVRHISLEGDLTEDQRQRLLEIADKCPVHKTLESQVRIDTKLV